MIDCDKISGPYKGSLVVIKAHHFKKARVTTVEGKSEVLARTSDGERLPILDAFLSVTSPYVTIRRHEPRVRVIRNS